MTAKTPNRLTHGKYSNLTPRKQVIDVEHNGETTQIDLSRPALVIPLTNDPHQLQAIKTLPMPTNTTLPSGEIRIKKHKESKIVRKRPVDKYIEYSVKEASQLDKEVEYEIDDSDLLWLALINKKRIKEGHGELTHDQFVYGMDRLEKESYTLSLSQDGAGLMPVDEDAVCCICKDGECENTNAILFCDACNIPVHQECYGVPFIPEGQWLCRPCQLSQQRFPECILCPNKGGALKQTSNNKWAHVSCAMWIPEAHFSNDVFLEPINVTDIPKARFQLRCSLCNIKDQGACIQCHKGPCCVAYHVTCAQKHGLYMHIDVNMNEEHSTKISYCPTHAPKSHKKAASQQLKAAYKLHSPRKKGKNNQDNSNNGGNDEIPTLSIPTISNFELCGLIDLKYRRVDDKNGLASDLLDYWLLKRQSRSGIPLLRRLQSQQASGTEQNNNPLSASNDQGGDADGGLSQQVKKLRLGLEKLRLLAELVLKREKMKRELIKVQRINFLTAISPLRNLLLKVLGDLDAIDDEDVFSYPVDTEVVKGYLDNIEKPMDLSTMRIKVLKFKYFSVEEFQQDFDLMINNAKEYNEAKDFYFKEAKRVGRRGTNLINKLYDEIKNVEIDPCNGIIKSVTSPSIEGLSIPDNQDLSRVSSINMNEISSTATNSSRLKHNNNNNTVLPSSPLSQPHHSRKSRRNRNSGSDDNLQYVSDGILIQDVEKIIKQQELLHETQIKLYKAQMKNVDISQLELDLNGVISNIQKLGGTPSFLGEDVIQAKIQAMVHKGKGTPKNNSKNNSNSKNDGLGITKMIQRKISSFFNNDDITNDHSSSSISTKEHSPSRVSSRLSRYLKRDENNLPAEMDNKNYKRRRSDSNSNKDTHNSKRSKTIENSSKQVKEVKPRVTSYNKLVWAKQKGFPYFPAVLVDYKNSKSNDIPDILLNQQMPNAKDLKKNIVLVRFYDNKRNWAWVPLKDVFFLGACENLDEKMLYKQNKGKKSQVKAAYRLALAHKEGE